MNWLDLLIIINILVPSYIGFKNGILRKLFGLAGIIVGFILAVKFYGTLSEFILKTLSIIPAVSTILSFLFIILLVYGISVYLAKYMSNLHPSTNILNKLIGALAGFIQGLIITSIVLFSLNHISFPSEETRSGSLLYSKVVPVAPLVFDKLINLLPGNKNILDEFKRDGKEKDTDNRRR